MGKDIPIVVLGGGGVGKSCLTIQYIQGHFVDRYDATIEDIYRKRVSIDGRTEVLMIVDTAGQEAFATMRDQYMKSGLGFVLVYSITDSESFHQLKKIYAQLRRTKGEAAPLPCIVVANKTDLASQRAVSAEEGMMFAQQANAPFVETTAKDRHQVEEVFATLVRAIHHTQSGGSADSGASASPTTQNNANTNSAQSGSPAAGGAEGLQPNPAAPSAPTPAAPAPAPEKKKKKKRCTVL